MIHRDPINITNTINPQIIKDMETSQYITETTSLTLVRMGDLVEVLFSNKSEVKSFYKELAEKFKQTDSNDQVIPR